MALKKFTKTTFLMLALLLLTRLSPGTALKPGTLVGASFYQLIRPGDTLIELARQHGVGYDALIHANPTIDPWQSPPDTEILIPRAAIIPYQAQPGVTINLAEKRLYLIRQREEKTMIHFYPIGIGREGRDTPTGDNRIVTMVANQAGRRPPACAPKTRSYR